MTFAVCFWILMLLLFLVSAGGLWPRPGQPFNKHDAGVGLLLFLILMLLGWETFKAPLHG